MPGGRTLGRAGDHEAGFRLTTDLAQDTGTPLSQVQGSHHEARQRDVNAQIVPVQPVAKLFGTAFSVRIRNPLPACCRGQHDDKASLPGEPPFEPGEDHFSHERASPWRIGTAPLSPPQATVILTYRFRSGPGGGSFWSGSGNREATRDRRMRRWNVPEVIGSASSDGR